MRDFHITDKYENCSFYIGETSVFGSHLELQPDLRKSKSKLNISNHKYDCLQLSVQAPLYPIRDLATCKVKYVNNVFVPR